MQYNQNVDASQYLIAKKLQEVIPKSPNLMIQVLPDTKPKGLQPVHFILLAVVSFILYSFKGK